VFGVRCSECLVLADSSRSNRESGNRNREPGTEREHEPRSENMEA